MTGNPDETASFYGRSAATYASDTGAYPVSPNLQRFAARLAPGARILELGCGSGRESAWMLAQGLYVHPTDGVAEMATEASVRSAFPSPSCPSTRSRRWRSMTASGPMPACCMCRGWIFPAFSSAYGGR